MWLRITCSSDHKTRRVIKTKSRISNYIRQCLSNRTMILCCYYIFKMKISCSYINSLVPKSISYSKWTKLLKIAKVYIYIDWLQKTKTGNKSYFVISIDIIQPNPTSDRSHSSHIVRSIPTLLQTFTQNEAHLSPQFSSSWV